AEKIRSEAEKTAKTMSDRAEAELDKARAQAQRILDAAKKTSNDIFTELNELKRADAKRLDAERIENARKAIKQQLKDTGTVISDSSETEEDDENYVLPRELKAGDRVLLADIGREAVVKSVSGNTVYTVSGRFETKTDIKNIRLLDEDKKQKQKGGGKASYDYSISNVKPEIDVRGNVGDDAWYMVDKWLDEIMMTSYETVTVIHGKGTGALRSALWQFFRNDKRIKSYRFGKYGEGETGVTIIEIKRK
ncbi:MAG: Smr/MutS family protein, partial [Clostridiales bacterium]|nr:Smr/MutS family protein [Candidatus Coliplasma equi]